MKLRRFVSYNNIIERIINKFLYTQKTRKRKLDKLVAAETFDGGMLREAAEKKNDESILMHIRGKDCVAIEVKYHKTCLLNYCRFLTRTVPEKKESDLLYKKSYDVFCASVIVEKIIQQKKVSRMTELHEKFIKTVQETEGIDATGYRKFRLKARLQRDYPQLIFHRPSRKNQSEFVFVEEWSVGEAFEKSSPELETAQSSQSETDEEMHLRWTADLQKEVTLKELYDVAIALRTCMSEIRETKLPWPPTSVDFTDEMAFKMIPVKLFNFVSWILGFSDAPEMQTYIRLKDSQMKKVLSLCQDMLFIYSNGRIQTPKSLALGMTVRQLTRSSQLTDVLNGFGHCASRYAVLTHETDLARLSMTTESNIPKDIEKNKFTCLVFDNDDFSEDSRNQTHVLGGIAIQRESEVLESVVQPPKKKKGRRSLQPPPTVILPYHLGKKKTPSFSIEDERLDEDYYLDEQTYARVLDFAYVLMRVYQSQVDVLPGWTGFNMLAQGLEIPPVSKIRYLPIVDGSPSEYSTLYTALQQSMKIADELSLEKVVLVFDEAIYAKIQQIRWKYERFISRFIVRLGDFHATMSFLSAIGKLFGDAGLQVNIFIFCIPIHYFTKR